MSKKSALGVGVVGCSQFGKNGYVRNILSFSGGGSLASTAVHVIGLAFWFLGSPKLKSVTGHADLPKKIKRPVTRNLRLDTTRPVNACLQVALDFIRTGIGAD